MSQVHVRVGSKLIERWTEYSIDSDMLTLADAFSLTFQAARPAIAREVYDLCKPDNDVQVIIDDTVIVTGFVDSRRRSVQSDTSFVITGRDKGGRLVDESMEVRSFNGLDIKQVMTEIVKPWFPRVITSNIKNRQKLMGAIGVKAKIGLQGVNEDGEATTEDALGKAEKVRIGETRAQVAQAFLAQVGYLGWGAADGQAFIVGLPEYNQPPVFKFFLPTSGSERMNEGNVQAWDSEDNVGERYSQITVVGSVQTDTDDEVPPRVTATVKNGPGAFGVGKDFAHRKVLLIADDDVKSYKQATVRAKREMAERDGVGRKLTIRTRGHRQISDARQLLYAFDTMASVEDEGVGLSGTYMITGVQFTGSKSGENAALHLVPKGTTLKT